MEGGRWWEKVEGGGGRWEKVEGGGGRWWEFIGLRGLTHIDLFIVIMTMCVCTDVFVFLSILSFFKV